MSDRPNLLVFFTDQQRPDTIGCYGQDLPLTPNLDGMAAQGLRCDRAFTPNPVCGPARAALQTGCYPTTSGCYANNIHLPEDIDGIAKILGRNGYATGYLGKWHLASSGRKDSPENFRTSPVPESRRGGYADYWLAADALEWTSQGYGGIMYDADGNTVGWDVETYRVDFMADRLCDAIEDFSKEDRPFYMMASFLEPHHQNHRDIYEAPNDQVGKYADAPVPDDLTAFEGSWGEHWDGYLGCIRGLDRALGRVLTRLEELGIADNTLVVFTTDHGCHFKTRNQEYKRSCHDSSIHIPLVIRGPGFEAGSSSTAFANLLDVPATLLRAAGVDVPEHWHGRPLQDLGSDGWRTGHLAQISESQTGRCLRTERWTYSVRVPNDPTIGWQGGAGGSSDAYVEDFLYDNESDPDQLTNLAVDPAYAEIRATLREQLLVEMAAVGEAPADISAAPGEGPAVNIVGAAASAWQG